MSCRILHGGSLTDRGQTGLLTVTIPLLFGHQLVNEKDNIWLEERNTVDPYRTT